MPEFEYKQDILTHLAGSVNTKSWTELQHKPIKTEMKRIVFFTSLHTKNKESLVPGE